MLLVSACAAQPGGAPAPPPLPGMTPVPVAELVDAGSSGLTLNADQVEAALLAPTDVPAGWTQPVNTNDSNEAGERLDSATFEPASCRDLATADSPTASDVTDSTRFITTDQHLVIELVTSWHDDAATRTIDTVHAYVAGCPTFTVTDSVVTMTEHLSETPGPELGEQSVALHSYATVGGQTAAESHQVVVIVGRVSVTIIATGRTLIDEAVLDQLVATAVAKVRAAG
ncbi:hypothetical protein ACPPVS_16290 [Cellulomonas sp. McL0617]|uniref:hypothetical protein n=1 Tax=Cellulomonas sp. McL0617 TaxID=3415675 RepID=UPI003CE7A319